MIYKQREVNIEKIYCMPKNLVEKKIDDKILIISVENANWIVLDNDIQKNIFYKLREKSIEEIIEYMDINNIEQKELINVLTQLEAKKFEDMNVNYPQEKGMCIYLTNECNLRCKHCYMFAGIKNEDELTTNEICKLLDDFSNSSGKVVTFTGGEVTQRNDLCKILEFSKAKGLLNTVLTNGNEWSKNLIESSYKFIDEVQISIDGYDEKSNSNIRGKGTFKKSLNTAEKFFNKGVRLSIAVTPLYEGLKENKDKYIQFGKDLIKRYSGGQFHLKFNYKLLKGREVDLNEKENDEYFKIMHEIVNKCYINSEKKDFIINHSNNVILNNCGYGEITVAANGDIYFCNRIYELKSYGNIRSLNFDKVMELSKKIQLLSNINNFKPCCDCELKYICGGGCRISNFPELIQIYNFQCNVEPKSFKPRKCHQALKQKYYKLMVDTNEQFFR